MTRCFTCSADWRVLGRTAIALALDATGTALITSGRVLILCGAQLRALSARFELQ